MVQETIVGLDVHAHSIRKEPYRLAVTFSEEACKDGVAERRPAPNADKSTDTLIERKGSRGIFENDYFGVGPNLKTARLTPSRSIFGLPRPNRSQVAQSVSSF